MLEAWSGPAYPLHRSGEFHAPKVGKQLLQLDAQLHPGHPGPRESSYELFFLRSAQRFFIISDSRFLPAGVRPPRFFLREVAACGAATLRFAPAAVVSGASNAAMARSSRSLSLFNSATIERMSKVRSLWLLGVCILRLPPLAA